MNINWLSCTDTLSSFKKGTEAVEDFPTLHFSFRDSELLHKHHLCTPIFSFMDSQNQETF